MYALLFATMKKNHFSARDRKVLSFRFACICSPERGNQPGAISFTLITFYYYEQHEGVYGRYFVLSLAGDAKVRQASRRESSSSFSLFSSSSSARSRAAFGRAKLAIHSRAWLLLSRWRGLRTCLTGIAAR